MFIDAPVLIGDIVRTAENLRSSINGPGDRLVYEVTREEFDAIADNFGFYGPTTRQMVIAGLLIKPTR